MHDKHCIFSSSQRLDDVPRNLLLYLTLKAKLMQIIIRVTELINTLELCTTAICVARTALKKPS